jgi:hypothetical protein
MVTTVADWLGTRTPAPPRALRERLRALLEGDANAPADQAAAACLDAGERVLRRLLAEGCGARTAALDLLTADALVTYAFEAGSARPETLDALSERSMATIAALAQLDA